MKRLRKFLVDPSAATAAEFALVLPVALLFLLGTIDVGRYFWTINKLEKAVQIGTRYAVATGVVSIDLDAMDFADRIECVTGAGNLPAGENICKDALGTITCVADSNAAVTCNCTESVLGSGSCPDATGNVDTAAFTNIVDRMRVIAPQIRPANVRITYAGSGLGFAGDPRKDEAGDPLSQVSPIVTVQVLNQRMRTISLLGLGLRLPSFQYSQTLEDGEGAVAY